RSSSRPTCPGTAMTSMPSSRRLAQVCAQASSLREEIASRAPAAPSRRAVARPMPRVAPVITATLPSSRNNGFGVTIVTGPVFDERFRTLVLHPDAGRSAAALAAQRAEEAAQFVHDQLRHFGRRKMTAALVHGPALQIEVTLCPALRM